MNGKTLGLWAAAVLVVAPGPGQAGYRDLAEQVDAYEPTGFYQANVQPRPAPKPAEAVRDGFEAEKAVLRQQKEQWTRALETGDAEAPPFLRPAPPLVAALAGAGRDPAEAEAALKDGFSLEALEVLVLSRNPGVRSAARKARASLEAYDQATNLDEILRQYTAFTEGLMTGIGPMKGREPVALRFPFPGVLSLKGEIVGQEVRAARETLEIARRDAVTAGRKAYWALGFVRSAQEITGEMLTLLQRLEAVARARYEAGRTSFQDVIKVRIRRETVEKDLDTLAERQRNLEARIRELVDLPPTAAVGTPAVREPDLAVPDLDTLYATALDRRQELRRLRARVGKLERMLEMAETRIYPAYSLNLSLYDAEAVTRVGTFRTGEPFATTTVASTGAGLPRMPWFGANDAYLRETRQDLEALRERLRAAENAAVLDVRNTWFRLDEARREVRLYGDSVVALSQAALEVSTRGYETGEVPFADVIVSYTTWLEANLALERWRAGLGSARAALEAAVGVSPLSGP